MPGEAHLAKNALDAVELLSRKIDDHFDRSLGIARLLIDLCLLFQVPLKLSILRKFELHDRVRLALGYLEISWAAAVVDFPAHIQVCPVPG